jgi:hypothetical protein
MRRFLMPCVILGAAIAAPSAAAQGTVDEYDHFKHAKVFEALDIKVMITAAASAAEASRFKISFSSVDSGIVRVYEEHLRVDTLQHRETFASCGLVMGRCMRVDVSSKPQITDDRGMVTTWRLISVMPAGDGKFRVTFEKWHPDGSGFAEAEGRDRERFFNAIESSLREMTRGVGRTRGGTTREQIAQAGAALANGTGPEGLYELVSINGNALPFPSAFHGTITSGSYLVQPAGQFVQVLFSSIGTIENKGKYTINGASAIFNGSKALHAARVEGDSLTYAANGARFVYRRKK